MPKGSCAKPECGPGAEISVFRILSDVFPVLDAWGGHQIFVELFLWALGKLTMISRNLRQLVDELPA